MLELVSKAWETNKPKLLMVAIPTITLIFCALFFKGWRSWLLSSAEKLLRAAQKKDQKISEEADKLDVQANQHKKKADEIRKKTEKLEDDPDWNKKL